MTTNETITNLERLNALLKEIGLLVNDATKTGMQGMTLAETTALKTQAATVETQMDAIIKSRQAVFKQIEDFLVAARDARSKLELEKDFASEVALISSDLDKKIKNTQTAIVNAFNTISPVAADAYTTNDAAKAASIKAELQAILTALQKLNTDLAAGNYASLRTKVSSRDSKLMKKVMTDFDKMIKDLKKIDGHGQNLVKIETLKREFETVYGSFLAMYDLLAFEKIGKFTAGIADMSAGASAAPVANMVEFKKGWDVAAHADNRLTKDYLDRLKQLTVVSADLATKIEVLLKELEPIETSLAAMVAPPATPP